MRDDIVTEDTFAMAKYKLASCFFWYMPKNVGKNRSYNPEEKEGSELQNNFTRGKFRLQRKWIRSAEVLREFKIHIDEVFYLGYMMENFLGSKS